MMYQSLHSARAWMFNVTPAVIITARLDWSGDDSHRVGSGNPCDVQKLIFSIDWLFWSISKTVSWRISR